MQVEYKQDAEQAEFVYSMTKRRKSDQEGKAMHVEYETQSGHISCIGWRNNVRRVHTMPVVCSCCTRTLSVP